MASLASLATMATMAAVAAVAPMTAAPALTTVLLPPALRRRRTVFLFVAEGTWRVVRGLQFRQFRGIEAADRYAVPDERLDVGQ